MPCCITLRPGCHAVAYRRQERPGLVHRLDKETSGVMVIAKTDQSHRALAAQFKLHTIARVYEALVWGVPKKGHGLIDLAIGPIRKSGRSFHRDHQAEASATDYQVEQRYREDCRPRETVSPDRTDPSIASAPDINRASDLG